MELLSPAGSLSSAYAAFKGGADAIYCGGKSFSARASANNFSNEELEEITDFAHSIGKKVYVTLNTLLFQDEFKEAVEFSKFLYQINVDGVIIQDLGLAHYLHTVLPDLPLNASTQLNCHNIKQAKALIKVGFKRIVLARETTLEFAKQVKQLGVEVEVFGHGALCVSYSGNCLMSSFIGNRSGNRGRCAQPCRMNYDLLEDDQIIAKNQFLLSTKDLMSISFIDKFIEIGVDSFKIEGRLKSNEYIYEVSKAYRHAIDKVNGAIITEDINNLTKIFTRKFSKGFVLNESPFSLLNFNASSHQGEVIGRVVTTFKNRVKIELNKDLHRLDGIRFNSKEQFGLTVENIFLNRDSVEIGKAGQSIELSGIDNPQRFKGVEVIKTKDYLLTKSIEEELKLLIKVHVKAKVEVKLNKPISLEVSYLDKSVKIYGEIPVEAEGSGTSKERIIEQLQKSGDYPYLLDITAIDYEKCFVPISSINSLRNESFEKLKSLLITKYNLDIKDYYSPLKPTHSDIETLICYEKESQVSDELMNQVGFTLFRYDNNSHKRENRVTSNSIFNKDNEFVNFLIEKENKNHLIASPYCNITNSYALDCFYSFGFDLALVSNECDFKSIIAMIEDFKNRHKFNPSIGMLVYGKIDLMLLKSCPIGTIYQNKSIHCNKCHQHKYELIDRIGVKYRCFGDSDCSFRILNDKPVCLFNKMNQIKGLNITPYILLSDESKDDIDQIINSYQNEVNVDNCSLGHFKNRPL